jgi:hypothetical protein
MKLFENIAEYSAFKKQYEVLGALENERLSECALQTHSLEKFFQFINDVLALPVDSTARELLRENELQEDIEQRQLFLRLPIPLL